MGLIEQEIKELREMNKKVMAGEITAKEVNQRVAIYSQTEKRSKLILRLFELQVKHGSEATVDLLSDGSMINHGK
jgi:hypothetical protein